MGRWSTRSVNVGSYVGPGQQVMAVVPDRIWVTANFKETQLVRMKRGQHVDIHVDAFPDVKFEGHVDSIQRGAGQAFAILPPQNATGNYVKVVQRVPVRILFDTGDNRPGSAPVGDWARNVGRAAGQGPLMAGKGWTDERSAAGKRNPWLIVGVISLATFMEVLDTSIANVSLNHIAGSLSASQDEVTWVLTSYFVSNAIIIPISGWLSDVIGRKRYYMISVALFTLSSLLCGFAPNLGMLVFARVLQGIGGGGLAPSEQELPCRYLPAGETRSGFCCLCDRRRGRAGAGADAGRLHHRQCLVALDFPDQRTGGNRLVAAGQHLRLRTEGAGGGAQEEAEGAG